MPSAPPPDDWQAAAAQHRQDQFQKNVNRVGKQARRGNYFAGGCMMFCGVVAMLLSVLVALGLLYSRGSTEDLFDGIVNVAMLGGGGLVTVVVGWVTFRHRRSK